MNNLPVLMFSIFLVFYGISASFICYHLLKFSVGSSSKFVLGIYLLGAIFLVGLSIFNFRGVPWESWLY